MSDVSEKTETPESNSPAPSSNPSASSSASLDWLTDGQMEMVHFIERHHAMLGEPPSDNVMRQRYDITEDELREFKTHPLVLKSMKYRGINYPSRGELLSDRQMHAIATMTNYVDKRSDEKKLRDMGITSREWSQWMLDEEFQKYLNERSERMLIASQHQAHLGLVKGARNGNVAAVKLYNEMTGRYNPDQENNLNVRILLGSFIEVLQRHIKDPVIMHAIATEMMNVASRQSIEGNASGLPGRFAPPVMSEQKVIPMRGEL